MEGKAEGRKEGGRKAAVSFCRIHSSAFNLLPPRADHR